MKITLIDLHADSSCNLSHIKMSRLGRKVVIAGRNGSGKTRLLTKIKDTFKQSRPSNERVIKLTEDIEDIEEGIRNFEKNIKMSEMLVMEKLDINELPSGLSIAEQRRELKALIVQKENLEKQMLWKQIETDTRDKKSSIIDFVPRVHDLKDPNNLTKSELILASKEAAYIGVATAHNSTLSMIQVAQDNWFNSTHPNSVLNETDRVDVENKYTELEKHIKLFLETSLKRDEDGDATIFDRKLGEAKLSEGQTVLLQTCVALLSQGRKLEDLIIFMDEPENHLHPSALVTIIDKFSEVTTNGQLWIATHSISLLSLFDPHDIWCMSDGEIRYSGREPTSVLEGMLGGEQGIGKLRSFLSLPVEMANHQFALECLIPPTSVMTSVDDPQTLQILDAIELLKVQEKPIRVLDFGGGKGRLLATIEDLEYDSIADWLDYYVYDLPGEDNAKCKDVLAQSYGASDDRFFTSPVDFLNNVQEKSFDIVVMCNVFHEIEPNKWTGLFSENSILRHALKEEGTLLIVEDQLLAIGERAYRDGFLVFDQIHFKKLFKLEEGYIVRDARDDGRLKAHFIPSKVLSHVDTQSTIAAVETLKSTSLDSIRDIRRQSEGKEGVDYTAGRKHAFWVQQLANSILCLDKLS